MLVAAYLGLGTRLVTELTVYMPRCRAHLRPWPRYGNDDLVRGMARLTERSAHALYLNLSTKYKYTQSVEKAVKLNHDIV